MRIGEFGASIKEGEETIVGFDDFKICVDDKLAGGKVPIERAVISAATGELQLVINSGVAETAKELAEDAAGIYGPATHLLERFLQGKLGSFFQHIFEAIQLADPVNLMRLQIAFPAEVAAFKQWTNDPKGRDFATGVIVDQEFDRETADHSFGVSEVL